MFQGWQKTVFQQQKEGFSTVFLFFFFRQVFQWCLNGEKENVSTRKKNRCAHSGFTVTKKVFQRCLKGYKKKCFDGEKRGFITVVLQ